MESAELIPAGSCSLLRKMAKIFKRAEPLAVAQLANAMKPAKSLDDFLLGARAPQMNREMKDILKQPVLIVTTDQEPKQFLVLAYITAFSHECI